jgi:hypothetical protein
MTRSFARIIKNDILRNDRTYSTRASRSGIRKIFPDNNALLFTPLGPVRPIIIARSCHSIIVSVQESLSILGCMMFKESKIRMIFLCTCINYMLCVVLRYAYIGIQYRHIYLVSNVCCFPLQGS